MGNIFIAIYNFFAARKWLLWLFTVGLFAFVAFFATRLKLEEDITKILPRDRKIEHLQQFLQNTKFADKLAIMISAKGDSSIANADSLTVFADAFVAATQDSALAPYITKIQAQTDDASMLEIMQAIQDDLPVYLDSADYAKMDTLISPATVHTSLENDFNLLISPAGMMVKKIIQVDPVGLSWIGIKKLRELQYDDHFELYNNYIVTKDHQHLLLFITPKYAPNQTGKNKLFLERLDEQVATLQALHPSVALRYFGATAVSVGNALQLQKDTILTQGITILLLVVLIALFFRKKRAPVLVMLPVLFGGGFALAMIYFIQGTLSVIALGAGCVVLGIAVNYSLHVFNHYRHLPDARKVIRDLATPMTVGSFTTVGGFLCLQFVKSPMLKDIGLFAAFSLIGAALFSLVILPHFIVPARHRQTGASAHNKTHKDNWLDRWASGKPEKNKWLVGGIFVLTIIFCFTAGKVQFEDNMMRMNYMPKHLIASEKLLNEINSFTAQSVYIISKGKNLDEALANRESILPKIGQLQKDSAIFQVSGVGNLLLSSEKQVERLNRWNAYWTASKRDSLIKNVTSQGQVFGFKPTAFQQFERWLNKDFQQVEAANSPLLSGGFLSDFVNEKDGQTTLVTILKVAPDQKDKVYEVLDGDPQNIIFDKQYTANRLAEVVRDEFNSIAWMTSLLVFIALLLSYGRIELALITFIPMVISWVWILGIMGLFGIKFNIVNIILSTFIFGLGDDYSIFTMDGLLQEYKTGGKHVSSFKSSIFLSAITTILGLGVLIFAQHPSLRSIALIAIIGIGCVVITSQVLIPLFFNWLITNRVKKGKAPWKLSSYAKSVFSLSYFAVGSMFMTLLGWILLKWNPWKGEKSRYYYHLWLSRLTWSTLHIMTNVKKKVINEPGEDFKKPAIIISNHQSFLDILISTGLSPKIILLTNQWVWNSPVFGKVVQMAEYYPVADGVEGAIDLLKQKIDAGYSVVIYPEGTRSESTSIGRFHKGAFYLAEQLQVDILPVVIHGTAYTMSKNDFLLKDGYVTEQYLPRIHPDDKTWGETYSARTKSISKYFKQAYKDLALQMETPKYFREQLIYNYIYKGPILEWYMRVKTKLEDNYNLFNQLVPRSGKIMDIGCGYGFMAYMLHWVSPGRIITGVDYDEDKIATANHAYLKNEHINFIHADIMDLSFEKQDCFILSDVFHYLNNEQQEILLNKCLEHLLPGGIIILRDGDASIEKMHNRTRLTELFSTKILGFNKSMPHGLNFVTSKELSDMLQKAGATFEIAQQSKITSNIVFIIKHSSIKHHA